MTSIPTLTTTRLLLRPMRSSDRPTYAAFMASERSRHMGRPFATGRAWGMFCADHAQWDFYGVGALMMEDRDSGQCIGQVGINTGPLFPDYEIGWLVFPEAEKWSYAFEAASALRDWARTVQNVPSLVSYVQAGNTRSCRLAQRLEAVLDPTATGHAPDDLVYRHYLRAV